MGLPAVKPATCKDLFGLPENLVGEIIGGHWILDESELHRADDLLVPDVAGRRREPPPRPPETAWFEPPPDRVCEIFSPPPARVDRAEKLPIHARHGVRHAGLVAPDLRTPEVFENRDGRRRRLTVLENDAAVLPFPFDAISISLAGLRAD